MSGVPDVRVRRANDRAARLDGEYVLYWMIAQRRVRWNFALQRAAAWAEQLGRPLVVFEPLRGGTRGPVTGCTRSCCRACRTTRRPSPTQESPTTRTSSPSPARARACWRLAAVAVRYEPLPTIASPEEARHPRAGIHDHGDAGNIHKAVALDFGDVPGALASAEHVFEDHFFYQGSNHLALEKHATLAYLDPDGRVVIASSTQVPHYLHRAAAKVLGLPPARIRIIAQPQGGGFGGKTDLFGHEIVAARAALITGRPVKISLTREEVFYWHRGRHPVRARGARRGLACRQAPAPQPRRDDMDPTRPP